MIRNLEKKENEKRQGSKMKKTNLFGIAILATEY